MFVSSCTPSPTAPYDVLTLSHELKGPGATSIDAPALPTETVAFAVAVSVPFVQATEYPVVIVGETLADPDVAFPVENPDPAQELEFVEDHARVEDWPLEID